MSLPLDMVENNIRFIAHAPTDIAALIAEVEKRDKVIEAAKVLANYCFEVRKIKPLCDGTYPNCKVNPSELIAALAELEEQDPADKEAAHE